MKKLVLILTLMLISLVSFQAVIFANDSYVNNNGIQIKYSDYNKLQEMGYSIDEIDNFTLEEYNKHDLKNIVIISSKTDYYILENDSGKMKRAKIDRNDYFDLLNKKIIPDDVTIESMIPLDDLGGGGTPPSEDNIITVNGEAEENIPYYSQTMTLSYNLVTEEIFAKTTVFWDILPPDNLIDFVSFSHALDVGIDRVEYDNIQRPQFDSKIIYHITKYESIQLSNGTFDTTILPVTEYDHFDETPGVYSDPVYKDMGNYGIVAIYYLNNIYDNYGSIVCSSYNPDLTCAHTTLKILDHISLTLEAYFHKKASNMYSTTINASYRHQYEEFAVVLDSVGISLMPPAITINFIDMEYVYEYSINVPLEVFYVEE